jgi:hypothetical protein
VFPAPVMRSSHYSPNYGADLVVVGASYQPGTTLEQLDAGTAVADAVMLSADGRHWLEAWHEGADSGDAVYVERRVHDGGLGFHGWVDRVSRRIVQAG